jgi:hypothetical protein
MKENGKGYVATFSSVVNKLPEKELVSVAVPNQGTKNTYTGISPYNSCNLHKHEPRYL